MLPPRRQECQRLEEQVWLGVEPPRALPHVRPNHCWRNQTSHGREVDSLEVRPKGAKSPVGRPHQLECRGILSNGPGRVEQNETAGRGKGKQRHWTGGEAG